MIIVDGFHDFFQVEIYSTPTTTTTTTTTAAAAISAAAAAAASVTTNALLPFLEIK